MEGSGSGDINPRFVVVGVGAMEAEGRVSDRMVKKSFVYKTPQLI